MTPTEIDSLKLVIYDYAEENKAYGKRKSRWECLQFAQQAIEGNMIPTEIIDYITQLNYQTTLIKS